MSDPPNSSAPPRRHVPRTLVYLTVLVGLLLLVRTLPLGRWIEDLGRWVEGRGVLGVAVYALVYIAATLCFVPGSVLTLAGGALFGPFLGCAVVSLASTTAAGVAFLIARTFARGRVRELAQKHPRFDAIERAITAGGWRIVALLRLSPAFPFSAGNYLYGLTAVRFGPYLLASWIAMLPGTFLYVYLGHLAAELSSSAGEAEGGGRAPAEWVLLGAGLVATVAVTIYVTRLARQELRRRTEVGDEAAGVDPEAKRA